MAFEDNPKVQELLGILQSLGIDKRRDTAPMGVMDFVNPFDLPIGSDARRDAIEKLTEADFKTLADMNYGGANVSQEVPEVNWIGNTPLDPITGKVIDNFSHQVGEGYNQRFDSWSPTDGIPGQGNPHIGEPISNLGLPDTAAYKSGYSPGTGTNPNWGSHRYNYQKNIYDVQTINMMINQGAINPKVDQIVPRPDVGEGQYEIKLASNDNTLWNDQLQMFMSPDWMRSGSMGQERFKENIMGGTKPYKSLSPNTYRGSSNQPLKFT